MWKVQSAFEMICLVGWGGWYKNLVFEIICYIFIIGARMNYSRYRAVIVTLDPNQDWKFSIFDTITVVTGLVSNLPMSVRFVD